MKRTKEQKPNAEVVQAVDVELNEEQLDVVSGGAFTFPDINISDWIEHTKKEGPTT